MTVTTAPVSGTDDTCGSAAEAATHPGSASVSGERDPVLEQLEWLQRTRAERLRDRLAWNQAYPQ